MKQLKYLKQNEIKAIEELLGILSEKYGNKIKEIRLFGSKVKGEGDNESDIDIFILFDKKIDWKFKDDISRLVYDTVLKFDVLFDLSIFSKDELKDKKIRSLPFYINIINEGILLWKKRIRI